jgi:tRNA(Ile)-lysidine synthase
MSLEKKFKANLKRLGINKKESVLLAVSGGVDSMVLLHLTHAAGLSATVAHANYKLRGKDSDEDESFVKEACDRLKIPFHSMEFPINPKSNIQAEARELRYTWFSSLLQKEQIRYIITAHHLDDRVETFFINLIRGVGLKGLKSIPERNLRIHRPLLNFRKEELIHYAEKNGLNWREDASNQGDKYLRNRIRHSVIPVLEGLEEGSIELVGRSLGFLAEADTYFKRAAGKFISNMESNGFTSRIYDAEWSRLFEHPPLNKYVLLELGFAAGQLEELEKLSRADSGRHVMGSRFTAFRDRGCILFKPNRKEQTPEVTLPDPDSGSIEFPLGLSWKKEELPSEFSDAKTEAWFDPEKLSFPLKLRTWNHGDRFVPFGMKGSKKISDYLVDIKMPVPEKERTFVLLSGEDICWLVGHRIDDRFKVNQDSSEALHFELK